MRSAEDFKVILVMVALMFTGFLIAGDLMKVGEFGLNLSFATNSRLIDKILIGIARLVGVAMIGLGGWVSYQIIKA